jgi:hypothetical protein
MTTPFPIITYPSSSDPVSEDPEEGIPAGTLLQHAVVDIDRDDTGISLSIVILDPVMGKRYSLLEYYGSNKTITLDPQARSPPFQFPSAPAIPEGYTSKLGKYRTPGRNIDLSKMLRV